MRPISPITEVYGSLRTHARRRVEKPNSASDLREDARTPSRAVIVNHAPLRSAQASHFETRERASDISNAIPAPFIAHIIGQVLETKRADAASATRAFKANSEWRMANGLSAKRCSLFA